MHECPDCGQACACDQDDTWMDSGSDDCEHQCDPIDREDEHDDDFYDDLRDLSSEAGTP